MSEMYGDAFHEDKDAIVTYGKDILLDRSEFHYREFQEFPSTRCNDVSFMKNEELDANCRNILAVADTYICYSVTLKRNLLRLIDAATGEKAILRGHDGAIADLKVSPIDQGIFCSVDNADSNGNHTFVWKRESKHIDFKLAVSLHLKATLVVPHPTQSHVWCVSDGRHLAIFSINKLPPTTASSTYSSFSMNYKAENEQITNLSFSRDGKYLIGSIKRNHTNESDIYIWRINAAFGNSQSSELVIQGNEELQLLTSQFHQIINLENVLSLIALPNSYFAVVTSVQEYSFENNSHEDSISSSNKDEMNKGILNYQMKVYHYSAANITPELNQVITFHLPEFKSKLNFISSSLKNELLEISVNTEPKLGQYLVFASRKSRYVGLFAINPILGNFPYQSTSNPALLRSKSTDGTNNNPGKYIYHITLIDFISPVISLDVINVVAREHHSSEEGEHVEISCYQENKTEPGSSSIQQYHITVPSLFDYSKYVKNAENSANNDIKGRTILNLLSSVGGSMDAATTNNNNPFPASLSTPSSSLKKMNSFDNSTPRGLLSANNSTVVPPGISQLASLQPANSSNITLDFTPNILTVDKEELNKLSSLSTSVSSVPPALVPLREMPALLSPTPAAAPAPAISTPVTNSGLKKLDSSLLFGKKSTPAAEPPAAPQPVAAAVEVKAEPVVAAAPSLVTPTPSPGNDLLGFLKARTPSQNVNILSMLKGSSAPPAAVPVPAAPALVVPVAAAQPPKEPAPPAHPNIDDDDEEEEPSKPDVSSSSDEQADDEEEEEQGSTPAFNRFEKDVNITPVSHDSHQSPFQAALSATHHLPSFGNGSSPEMLYSLLLEMKQEITRLTHVTQQLQQETFLVQQQQKELQNSHAKVISSAVQIATNENQNNGNATTNNNSLNTITPQDLQQFKEDMLKEMKIQQNKATLHLAQSLKNFIDNENKKMFDHLNNHKQEILTSTQEILNSSKWISNLQIKLKETIKESVKENIKIYLADLFRNAFENSLLPAFQSGCDRLFAQLNVSFENGLKSLVLEMENILSMVNNQNIKSQEEIEIEIKSLIEKFSFSETLLNEMNMKFQQLIVNGNGISIAAGAAGAGEKGGNNEKVETAKPLTPKELLAQGLVDQAVRVALESKDVAVMVDLLGELTPQRVNASCSSIVRLCITQQLAADMSVNLPMEGVGKRVEWIKNLVLSLIKISKKEMENDPKLNKNFPIMIQAVLESIQSGKNLIISSQYDNGEEDPIEIPPSFETDLQLLECLIENRL